MIEKKNIPELCSDCDVAELLKKNRSTPKQGFLDNITRNIEHVIEDIKNNQRYLESLLNTPHLEKNNPILQDIKRTCKQLGFAINNLKDVPETAYVQWSELYKINPYY